MKLSKLSDGLYNSNMTGRFGKKSGAISTLVLGAYLLIMPSGDLNAGSTPKPTINKTNKDKATTTTKTKKVIITPPVTTRTPNQKAQDKKTRLSSESSMKTAFKQALDDGYSIKKASGYRYNPGTNKLTYTKSLSILLKDVIELRMCTNNHIGKLSNVDNIYKKLCGKFFNIKNLPTAKSKEYGINIKKHNFTLEGDILKIVNGTKGAMMTLFNAKKLKTCSEKYIGASGRYGDMIGAHNFYKSCSPFIKETREQIGVEHTLSYKAIKMCMNNPNVKWLPNRVRQGLPVSFINHFREKGKEDKLDLLLKEKTFKTGENCEKKKGKKKVTCEDIERESKIEFYFQWAMNYYIKGGDYTKEEGKKMEKLVHNNLGNGLKIVNYKTAKVDVNCRIIRQKAKKDKWEVAK